MAGWSIPVRNIFILFTRPARFTGLDVVA
jgi:hypothetical protein